MRKNWREFFLDCEQIEKVIYPGLADEDQTEIAERILNKNYRGAVFGIRLKTDSREAVYKFMNALKLCTRAASVGDIFTGVVHPATAHAPRTFGGKTRAIGNYGRTFENFGGNRRC